MANWHAREVKRRRGEFDDYIDKEIMEVIALHVGEDDSPATMSIATIASYAGVHYNTADKRTKALADAGWLKIEKRGRFLAYSLTFESEKLPEDERPPDSERKRDLHDRLSNLEQDVADLKDQLLDVVNVVRELHMTVTRLSHDLHIVITSHQSDYVKKEGKKERGEEEDIYPPTPLPVGLVGGLATEIFEDEPFDAEEFDRETAQQEMIAAISAEVRETYAQGTEDEALFVATADGLIADGHKPGDVRGFRNWWKDNGWYDNNGRPSLSHFFKHFKDFQDGACLKPRASPNGHGQHDKKPLYEPDENGIY